MNEGLENTNSQYILPDTQYFNSQQSNNRNIAVRHNINVSSEYWIDTSSSFKVSVNGAICFDPPHKSVNLKIDDQGYIIRLAKKINSKLTETGFAVRENIDNWDLHISLANTNYAAREWSVPEFNAACDATKQKDIKTLLKIDRIELWKPINNKKKMVVKSFPLKSF